MTDPAHPGRMLFVNMPVADLERSKAFFLKLGFGLDLDSCAASGSTEDLVAVSPRSGRAVSKAEAEPYAGRLLPLPRFVREGGKASWIDIARGLHLTGHFLMRDLLTQKSAVIGEARLRLVDRLRRAGGLD